MEKQTKYNVPAKNLQNIHLLFVLQKTGLGEIKLVFTLFSIEDMSKTYQSF